MLDAFSYLLLALRCSLFCFGGRVGLYYVMQVHNWRATACQLAFLIFVFQQPLHSQTSLMDTPKRSQLLTRARTDTERASRWWTEGIKASASASCDLPSVLNSPSKHNRAMEEEIKRLREDLVAIRKGYERKIGEEENISMSLRDRIGRLEEKFRKEKAKVEQAQIKESEMKVSLELLEDQLTREREDWHKFMHDLKETLAKEKDEKERLQQEIDSLKEEKSRPAEAIAAPPTNVFMRYVGCNSTGSY